MYHKSLREEARGVEKSLGSILESRRGKSVERKSKVISGNKIQLIENEFGSSPKILSGREEGSLVERSKEASKTLIATYVVFERGESRSVLRFKCDIAHAIRRRREQLGRWRISHRGNER